MSTDLNAFSAQHGIGTGTGPASFDSSTLQGSQTVPKTSPVSPTSQSSSNSGTDIILVAILAVLVIAMIAIVQLTGKETRSKKQL